MIINELMAFDGKKMLAEISGIKLMEFIGIPMFE
tara:strand:+ start:189 stop:290 length:102 start_codon:yes stop_codon:yes gene_type:complete